MKKMIFLILCVFMTNCFIVFSDTDIYDENLQQQDVDKEIRKPKEGVVVRKNKSVSSHAQQMSMSSEGLSGWAALSGSRGGGL